MHKMKGTVVNAKWRYDTSDKKVLKIEENI